MSVLISWDIATKLMNCFPNSVINHNAEFIAHIKSNTYLCLKDCENETDVKCKVLEWLSRPAFETNPYNTKRSNDKFHKFILNGVNQFLETDFSEEDMEQIYIYLGNRCNHAKTLKFIASGYDMSVLKD